MDDWLIGLLIATCLLGFNSRVNMFVERGIILQDDDLQDDLKMG